MNERLNKRHLFHGSKDSMAFVLNFIVLVVALNVMLSLLQRFFMPLLIRLTAEGAGFLGSLFGLSCSLGGAVLSVDGFSMVVDSECTAVSYLIIYIAGVLAWPDRSISSRVLGVLSGVGLIVGFNMLRITLLGAMGATWPNVFDVFHTYLWQGLFLLFIIGIWLLWIHLHLNYMKIISFVPMAVGVTLIAVLVMNGVMHYYMMLLARAGSLWFDLAHGGIPEVLPAKGAIEFLSPGIRVYFPLDQDVKDSLVVIVVALMIVLRNFNSISDELNPSKVIITAMKVMTLLVAMHFSFVLFVGESLHWVSFEFIQKLLWWIRIISITVPLLLSGWMVNMYVIKRNNRT